MFKINTQKNEISSLDSKTFAELGFRERNHLQEWIAKNPSCLGGEEFLIIQKEFSGFSDTQERLDLLALDKKGSLVIIENKLDDTGRDVTWQALKYASYCSSLRKEDIRKIYQRFLDKHEETAEEKLSEFFESEYDDLNLNPGSTQRIILIAANFRKEVTSTVLWLRNFNIRLECYQVTPYAMGEELFLNIEKIIPPKGTEEYMIGLAEKNQEQLANADSEQNRHRVRREFWTKLLTVVNRQTNLFQHISPGTAGYLGFKADGFGHNFVARRDSARVEIYIDFGNKEQNEIIFNRLLLKKEAIENSFGEKLVWEPLEDKRACRIKAEREGNIFDDKQWSKMIEFMTDAMIRLEKAFRPFISNNATP